MTDIYSGKPWRPPSAILDPSHAYLLPLLANQNHVDEEFNPLDLIEESRVAHMGARPTSVRGPTAATPKHSRHSAIPFMARMSALLIAIWSLLLGLSVLLWLLYRKYDPQGSIVPSHFTPSDVLAREPATRSDDNPNGTLATQFVAFTSPFLIGTVAYRLGFDWFKASQELKHERLPTQEQYGLIVNMFSVASVGVTRIWHTGVHLLQRNNQRAKAPQILLQGLADLALHSTTSSIVLPAVHTQDANSIAFGTFVNQSAVAEGSSLPITQEGVLASANQSTINQVFTLNNQSRMAYVSRLTANMANDVSFIAPTLGIESQCAPITLPCFSQFTRPVSGYEPQTAFNCSPAGYDDYHQSMNSTVANVLAVPDKALAVANNLNGILSLNRNPFPLVFIHFIRDVNDDEVDKFQENAMVPAIAREGYYIIVACNISVYDTVLRYSQGGYAMVNRTLSSPETSSFVTSRISIYANYYSNDYPDQGSYEYEQNTLLTTLTDDIRYSAANDSQELGDFISADLSRLLLSYSAGYLSAGPAHAIAYAGVITQYNKAALIITLGLILLYSLLALFVFGWASSARLEDVSYIGLAPQEQSAAVSGQGLVRNVQSRLSRPSSLVHALYASGAAHDAHVIPRPDGYFLQEEMELFEGEQAYKRLAISQPSMGRGDGTARLRVVVDSSTEDAPGQGAAPPQYGTYGLLIDLFSVGSLNVLLELGGFLKHRENRNVAPRMLMKAFIIHGIGLADLALHSTTTTVPLSSVNALDASNPVYQYGSVVAPYTAPFDYNVQPSGNGSYATRLEGMLTSSNRSALNSVFTLGSSELSYITRVNGLIPVDVSFIAPTIATSAQCEGITPACFNSTQLSPNGTGFDCSGAGYPEIYSDLWTETQFSVHDDQWTGNRSVKNPFMAFWQSTLGNPVDEYQFSDLLVNISNKGAYIVMACNITVYDVFLHYTNGSYTLLNQTVAAGGTAAFATYPLKEFTTGMNYRADITMNETYPILPRFLNDLQRANPTAAEFGATVSPNVARLVLSFSAGMLQPASATEVMADGAVTRYPLVPLVIYLVLVYLYALLALGIFVWSSTGYGFGQGASVGQQHRYSKLGPGQDYGEGTLSKDLTRRAQWHISQPSSLVEALFEAGSEDGGSDVEGSGDVDSATLRNRKAEKRIAIGLRTQNDDGRSEKRLIFGMWQVPVTPAFKEE
ncbi:hypothetical protein HWV62_3414 [Athelia sp. TMB]|nr:hypothetical protein HWV62_3414 [Athelia sp. TMB]